ncbi:MAG: hypothetical protein L0220_04595 [Acidobacteria bacterium]|nr:hypothetical protein [Acidobacteriota bacterium]
MNIEGGLFLFLGPMAILPVLYLAIFLVNRIAGKRLIPFWLPWVLMAIVIASGSLYLDNSGVVIPVNVVDKTENIHYRSNGNWNRTLSIQTEYMQPGELTPTSIQLGIDAETYDKLQIGETVETRMLEIGQVIKFARLKDRSTFSLITGLFPRTPSGPWREATALINEVRHIDKYTHRRGADTELAWPFDIVQLSFTPDGRDRPLIAVDVVETASAPGLTKGGTVRILWPEDDPRSARIVGARPGAPWANWFYGIGETIAIYAIFIVLFLLFVFIWRRRKKKGVFSSLMKS